LGSQAKSEYPASSFYGVPDEFFLLFEPWEFLFVIHAHWAPEKDEVVGICPRDFIGIIKADILEGNFPFCKKCLKVSKGLVGNMLEYGDFHKIV
jgi:hypothetical protein